MKEKRSKALPDLKPGDYVVHENHGLGIYQGIEKIEIDRIEKDYMKISYAGGGNLYIPATQHGPDPEICFCGCQKAETEPAGGDRTGSAPRRGCARPVQRSRGIWWSSMRQDRKRKATHMSRTRYGKRNLKRCFLFEETDDQLAAIEETKKDMESHKIMDRLICGDVGFGKTEVAVRAAFKAVQENKQVAFLVPTTILAQQHYNTLVQRMKDFPVRVDLMCRFRTPAQQKKTLEDLKKGQVDILVGTHRILSQDVCFKDLGLLVIDEEQRFGGTAQGKNQKAS